jgi:hypothetical protein
MKLLGFPLADAERRWRDYWFRPVAPQIYALLRIALGTVACIDLLGMSDLGAFWLPSGLAGPTNATLAQLVADAGSGAVAAGYLLFAFTAVAFVAFTLGVGARWATLAAFLASMARLYWTPLPLSSAHTLLHALLFCLLWVDSGAAWSFDARRRHRLGRGGPVTEIWPLLLLRFQLCVLYFSAGIWKLMDHDWREGSALHWILQDNGFSRIPAVLPPAFEPAASFLTYLTLVWELGFPFLLLFRRSRAAALVTGVVLHTGMAITMELGPFSAVVLAGYPAFLDPAFVAEIERTWLSRSRVRALPGH